MNSADGLRLIYGIWMILYLSASGVSIIRFVLARNIFPIANRHPLLVLIMVLAVMGFVMIFQIPVIFNKQDIPCTAWVYLMVFFALVAVNVVMLRVILLYVAFISTQKSVNFSDRITRRLSAGAEPEVKDDSGKSLTGMELKIQRWFIHAENFLFMKRRWMDFPYPGYAMCFVIFIEMIPMTAYAIRYPEFARTPVIDTGCRTRFIGQATTLFVILLSLYLVVLSTCAWRMKKLAENFFIVEEFKGIALGGCLTIVVVIIGRIPKVNDVIYNSYPIGLLLLTGIPAMVLWWFSLERINLISSKQHEQRVKNLTFRNTSTRMLTLDGQGRSLKQKSFDGKDNPDSNLYTFLQDEGGLELFKAFLMKEFCVENLLFWMDCNEIMHLPDETPDIPLRVLGMYSKYIHSNAPLMVNISSKNRLKIVEKVKILEATHMGKKANDKKHAEKSANELPPTSEIKIQKNDSILDKPPAPTDENLSAFSPDEKSGGDIEAARKSQDGFQAKTVFNDSCEEIFHLMSTDPFQRFCHTPEFAAWMKKHPGKLPETVLL
eukprot:TRINITY_DN7436_c0_g1_i1.p1 TRINITY_DN7436_c0_g1~~TRINITY_DN7436_c0_g1_i1.p1  ORF type:complete len:547 (-),score=138.89 TRINITY_DN7436_c0_g1_i1:26-1666(-)